MRYGGRWLGVVVRGTAMLVAALLAGALAMWAFDPGYEAQPLPGLFALGAAALALGAARSLSRRSQVRARYPLAAAAIGAIAGAGLLYGSAPQPIDRAAYGRVERALLAQIDPYVGAISSSPRIEPSSGSDGGISLLNPPETYLTSRDDVLPQRAPLAQVAAVYERELRRTGLAVSRFRLHTPRQQLELDGRRGPVLITVTVGDGAARLVARCQRNGPFDPDVLEPPCHIHGRR